MSQAFGVLAALYLAASTAGAWAQSRVFSEVAIETPPDELPQPPPPTTPSRATIRIHDAGRSKRLRDEITARSPFCPACRPEHPEDSSDTATGAVTWKDGTTLGPLLAQGEPETDLPLQLVATMQAEPPQRSMATIAREEGRGAGVFVAGDEVLEGVTLHTVGPGVVHLDDHGALEYLPLEDPAERKRHRPTRKRKKPPRKGKHEIDGAREAVHCDSDTSCTIDRALVQRLMAKPALLTRQARIRPYRKDGETVGFKVYGVRRGSLPKLLKMRNGDLITSINGNRLESMDAALGLYQKLRTARDFTLTLKRRGKEIRMQYAIR